MDKGTSRYKKHRVKTTREISEVSPNENADVVMQNQQLQLSTEANIDYCAEFKAYVFKKGHTNASLAALNCVREQMRFLYSSEAETFCQFRNYFQEYDIEFAMKYNDLLENDSPVIQWMKDSLIPFGKQLLKWCDGGVTLEQSLYRCNGSFSVYYYFCHSINYLTLLM